MTDASLLSSYLSGAAAPPPLIRLAALEARYDGPIPARELSALRFDSALAADIAAVKAEILFYRTMARRARNGGKAWLKRGDRPMARIAAADARTYLTAWRRCRHKLAELLHDIRARESRADIARQQTLAMVGAEIVAPLIGAEIVRPPVGGGQEAGL